MTEAAYRHWLADYLAGKQSVLIAHDPGRRRRDVAAGAR